MISGRGNLVRGSISGLSIVLTGLLLLDSMIKVSTNTAAIPIINITYNIVQMMVVNVVATRLVRILHPHDANSSVNVMTDVVVTSAKEEANVHNAQTTMVGKLASVNRAEATAPTRAVSERNATEILNKIVTKPVVNTKITTNTVATKATTSATTMATVAVVREIVIAHIFSSVIYYPLLLLEPKKQENLYSSKEY